MNYYISALIKGMDSMDELASWIDSEPFTNLGIELIAFTHDGNYWNKLCDILEEISCPISFHGPYINIEATSPKGSSEYDWMIESYYKVFALAKKYNIKYVVFHYTHKGFQADNIELAQKTSQKNIETLLKMAKEHQVNMLIENLPFPKGEMPLYNNEEYINVFDKNKDALSIIDLGHANMNRMNLERFLQIHGNRVKSYHLHNNDGVDDQHNSIMDGTFDYDNFFSLYKKYTPDADIILEYEPHTNMSHESLICELDYIEKQIGKEV